MPELQRSEYRPEFPLVSPREARAIPAWFLIQSQPSRERNIQVRLKAFKVESYLPLITLRRAGGRGENCPLFPSYLFGHFPANELSNINQLLATQVGTAGIGHVVCFGGQPAHVHAEIIAGIQEREQDGLIDLSAEQARENAKRVQSLEFGDKVVVLSGAFQGQQGIFQSCKDGRVKALFGLLNVTVAAREIARV